MHLLPRGYIGLQDATAEIFRRRYGEPVEIPWVKAQPMLFEGRGGIEESTNVQKLDTAVLTKARRQTVVSMRALRRALGAGRLTAEVDGRVIHASYWRVNQWKGTTLHIGTFETGGFDAPTGSPVGIRYKEFRAWLGRVVRPRRLASVEMTKQRLEAACRKMAGARAPDIQAAVKAALADEGLHVPKERIREAWKNVDRELKPKRGRRAT